MLKEDVFEYGMRETLSEREVMGLNGVENKKAKKWKIQHVESYKYLDNMLTAYCKSRT